MLSSTINILFFLGITAPPDISYTLSCRKKNTEDCSIPEAMLTPTLAPRSDMGVAGGFLSSFIRRLGFLLSPNLLLCRWLRRSDERLV